MRAFAALDFLPVANAPLKHAQAIRKGSFYVVSSRTTAPRAREFFIRSRARHLLFSDPRHSILFQHGFGA
ncbi:MAG: hypothetical protein ACREEM_42340, partial [Blastocatellia bacterium]